MSEDQNLHDVALTDNDTQAVDDSSTTQDGKLYAGKFKTPEDMEKSYLSLQSEYSRSKSQKPQPQPEQPSDDALSEVEPILKAWKQKEGLISRAELAAEKEDEENLNLYLSSNPDAKGRVEKLKLLSQQEAFRGKSYKEIDEFIGGSSSHVSSKPDVKMGSKEVEEEVDTKDPNFWFKRSK